MNIAQQGHPAARDQLELPDEALRTISGSTITVRSRGAAALTGECSTASRNWRALEVSREESSAAVTAPGPPHPWRHRSPRTWREAQLEVAALLRDTVATRSGGRSRLGLMSSGLGAASVEGRDWHRLFRTWAKAPPTGRTSPDGDAPALLLARSVALLALQRLLRPADAEVAPEVEEPASYRVVEV